jgi:hypothetical protein
MLSASGTANASGDFLLLVDRDRDRELTVTVQVVSFADQA